MRASASAGAPGDLPIGVIGEAGDLRYDYEHLGAGTETLKDLAAGNGEFVEVLKKAKHPLIIVGQGALARARRRGGARPGGQARAGGRRGQRTAGTALPCCTMRRRASAASTSASCRARAARTSPACWASIDVLFLLGADEIDMARIGDAFVVYIGTHGDAGAHRADVILPGAAYTEKSGTYVNTEGRVQMTNRAGFAPGEAKEDWAILRALSDVLGKQLPFDSLAQLRAQALCGVSASGARSTRSRRQMPADLGKAGEARRRAEQAARSPRRSRISI